MPPRKSKTKEIDPDLLPEAITKVGPHEPLNSYFTEEPPKELFEHWADYYEKKPNIAIRELISVILYIAGVELEISEKQISKSLFEEIRKTFHEQIEENSEDTPIEVFLKGTGDKAFSFWTNLCNSLIVSKGLYIDAFEIFKDWTFDFCEANDRTLRGAATVAVCAILEFLADAISKASVELQKLEKSKNKSSVTKHQIETFQTELDNSKSLAMQLYTSVVKPRLRDVDPRIRGCCIKTMGELSIKAPEEFADPNIIKVLEKALCDASPRNKKEALKTTSQILKQIEDLTEFKPFFKSISPTLVKICNDIDNGLVVGAFKLMKKMQNRKVFFCKETDEVFKMTTDDALNVRKAAAEFFYSLIFNGKIVKDVGTKNAQKLNEAQIREYIRLSSEFTDAELANSIEVFASLMDCFQNWELIANIIFSSDDKKEKIVLAKLLSFSAANSPEESISSLTRSMVSCLSKDKNQGLLQIFKSNNDTIGYLTSILQFLDITTLKAEQEKQFKLLLETLHKLFTSSKIKQIYMNIICGINSWCKVTGKMSKIAVAEFAKIVKDFSSLKDSTADKLDKFYAVATYHDFSDKKRLRDYLCEAADDDDNEHIASTAIKCLEIFFKWDVKALKGEADAKKAEYFESFSSLQTIFVRKLHSLSIEIKTAAFCALGTLLSLAKFVVVDSNSIDTNCFDSFVTTFHSIQDKEGSLKYLTMPIINHVVPIKYAAHVAWYLQDPDLKQNVRDFLKDIDEGEIPIDGQELAKCVRDLEFTAPKLKPVMKTLVAKFNARSVVSSWFDFPNDDLIPIYAPFLEKLDYNDAEFVKPMATGQSLEIIEKIMSGKKLKAKDFVVKVNKANSESNDEAESEGY